MDKREEIREWIAKKIYESMMSLLGMDFPEEYQPKSLFCDTVTNKILSHLHSQGVVIKVERELPDNPMTVRSNYEAWNRAKNGFVNAGYTAVEPLIEE